MRNRRCTLVCFIALFCVGAIVFSACKIGDFIDQQRMLPNNGLIGTRAEALPADAVASNVHRIVPAFHLNSQNAYLVDLENGSVLFEQNAGDKMYPASMTKIMTAIVVLEHCKDLDGEVLLGEAMFQTFYTANAATAGFLPGESVCITDLLYGLLLPSGAECAVGLAEYVAGSEDALTELMNAKARELGMNDTHFANSTGLHDRRHYSTVKDIAVLLEYALQNDTFYEMFTTAWHATQPTNLHSDGITYYSTLFANMDSAGFDGGAILGGKTGYTDEAGQCLASLAEKNGRRYILVTCGAPGDRMTQRLHIDDAVAVYAAIDQE